MKILLAKTIDGGENWTYISTDIEGEVIDGAFINETTGFAITFNDIYLTSNGGIDWQTEYTSETEILNIEASDSAVLVGGRDGLLLRRELKDLITVNNDLHYFSDKSMVYPNPANKVVYFRNNSKQTILSASILNFAGQTVFRSKKIENNKLDIGYLTSGIYLVRIEFLDNSNTTQKLIVKN